MSTENRKDAVTKPTGRRYSSVDDLLAGEKISEEIRTKVAGIEEETRLVSQLAVLRQMVGLTQEEMATRLGFTSQSAVSKLEGGRDEDVTIGQIREYVKASGERVGLIFGPPLNHVEAVKAHALGMRKHLSALASLARKGDDIKTEIQAFFGEAFFNILNILSRCQAELPKDGANFELRFEVLEKPQTASPLTSRPRSVVQREDFKTAVA